MLTEKPKIQMTYAEAERLVQSKSDYRKHSWNQTGQLMPQYSRTVSRFRHCCGICEVEFEPYLDMTNGMRKLLAVAVMIGHKKLQGYQRYTSIIFTVNSWQKQRAEKKFGNLESYGFCMINRFRNSKTGSFVYVYQVSPDQLSVTRRTPVKKEKIELKGERVNGISQRTTTTNEPGGETTQRRTKKAA